MCSTMFIAALFIIDRTWKQPRCPSTKKWIKKKCDTFIQWSTAQWYLKNDILKFADKWMDLEKNILSEVTQTQKDKYNTYSL